jgi:hypothetical protein
MRHPLFRDATSKIVGDRVSVFRSMFFNKPAEVQGISEGGVVIDWHQDGNPVSAGNPDLAGKQGGGWGLSIDPRLTVWTALDRTTIANGCLQIIRATGTGLLAAAAASAASLRDDTVAVGIDTCCDCTGVCCSWESPLSDQFDR